ncbi:NAD-dependent epimerase/dehydratase family protein [Aestuariibius insulae]|uniref:NAD-dependent epimerase/dehydratase family protein n=1 Tax=Aestuariibius insulae TaxID=2058287 RepID=UPI00345EEBDF
MSQTVLLTGVTGFIARHIAAKLLNAGYAVRGTLRDPARAEEVRDAIRPELLNKDLPEQRLSFVPLDLARDEGWIEALMGVNILMHTASPFPLSQPDDEEELIRPAVDGTLRALEAARAAGVKRVVMTSSTAAVTSGAAPDGRPFDERDWTDLEHPVTTPYNKSKTLAEQAAWDFVTANPEIELTVINPGFVLGKPLGDDWNTSVQVIDRIVQSKDPMLPHFGFATVDVGDVAEMHLRALERPETAGKRYLAVSEFLWFTEIAEIIAKAFPDRKITTRQAPNWVVRILALFDRTVRQLVPVLDRKDSVSNERAKTEMEMTFRPVRDAVIDTATAVIEAGRAS